MQGSSSFFSTDPQQSTQDTTAIASIAWENDFTRYANNIQLAVQYLTDVTYIGSYWYPTTSSYLSLRAIIGYLVRVQPLEGSADLVLLLDGEVVSQLPITAETSETVKLDTSSVNISIG